MKKQKYVKETKKFFQRRKINAIFLCRICEDLVVDWGYSYAYARGSLSFICDACYQEEDDE